ncbi:MAG: hypothetical protein HY710_14710 [Candidatus Latescibacteria bacterium]|nr:hypothetical protein [Candidatus Latescibacterota bacterium]
MKRWPVVPFIFLLIGVPATPGLTQSWAFSPALIDPARQAGSAVQGGFGWTRIATNDTGAAVNYVTLTLNPEIRVGKVGVGLTIDVLVNTRNDPGGSRIRQTELRPGHLLRYARYGQPDDPWYAQVGAFDRVTLGHGFILSRYSNQVADQSRRIGAGLKVSGQHGGIEALTNNLGAREIYGARAFFRPLAERPDDLLLRRLTIGSTLVIDENPGRGRTRRPAQSTEIFGLDIELPLLETALLDVMSYGDFAKILDYGQGGAIGVSLRVKHLSKVLTLTGRLEEQILGREFMTEFFDATYEVESVLASGATKTDRLRGLPGTRGVMGELGGVILGRLAVVGQYRAYGGRDSSGVLHAEARLLNVIPRMTLRASYDKKGVRRLSDLRTLDERSVVLAEANYRMASFLLVGLEYRWTFVFDDRPHFQVYRPQERFFPKVLFEYAF